MQAIKPVILLLALLLAGCDALNAGTVKGPHVECLVCKHNADLACVEIPLTADTIRADYKGHTFYFCSDECKQIFLKDPEKYVADAK